MGGSWPRCGRHHLQVRSGVVMIFTKAKSNAMKISAYMFLDAHQNVLMKAVLHKALSSPFLEQDFPLVTEASVYVSDSVRCRAAFFLLHSCLEKSFFHKHRV